MIENILPREELRAFSHRQSKDRLFKSVKKSRLEDALADGWELKKHYKNSIRIFKLKKKPETLESKVWTLFYNMGFTHLSGDGGAQLIINPKDENSPKAQLDVVAADEDIALAAECKSFDTYKKDPRFVEKIAKVSIYKRNFAQAINRLLPSEHKRHVGLAIFTWDYQLTENDLKRAEQEGVVLFNIHDLEYFEELVKHLGPAARYQFLAEVFPGKPIAGLQIRVPAIKMKMGKLECYNFAISPEYLLKVGYVARRVRRMGGETINTYQRMIKKGRLKKIKEYISQNGFFPTNIVINFQEQKYIRWDKVENVDDSGTVLGWATISPTYGSAWVIDGQHRLFGYSGHERAKTSYLNVLAFKGISHQEQANLFVDINSKQVRVSKRLLIELYSELHWEAEEESMRLDAIISKSVKELGDRSDSPLNGRVLVSEEKATDFRCITATTLFEAINKPGFFVISRKVDVTEYGPLWRNDSDDTFQRTVQVLIGWLSIIAETAEKWWSLGSGEGGGLATNNGVTVCINILRSVFEHLRDKNLLQLDNDDVLEIIKPYAKVAGEYFASMSVKEQLEFRQRQGAAGQNHGTRMCQFAMRNKFPNFNPIGLNDWIERVKLDTNGQANQIIDRIEIALQNFILKKLKSLYPEGEQWWFMGVPKTVRKKVDDQINESDGKQGKREQNFYLIHYREIITHNWSSMGEVFSYGGSGKDKGTKWLVETSEIRNSMKHPSRGEYISVEQLKLIKEYDEWLQKQVAVDRS